MKMGSLEQHLKIKELILKIKMKLERQIKLYILTGRGSNRTKKLMNIIENVFSKMEKRLSDKYPNSVFYLIGDNFFFFELDSKNEMTWVRYQGFWGKFQSDFGLNRDEIKWLTRYTLEQHLKGKVHPTGPIRFWS